MAGYPPPGGYYPPPPYHAPYVQPYGQGNSQVHPPPEAYGPGAYSYPAAGSHPQWQAAPQSWPAGTPQSWPAGAAAPGSDRPPKEQCFYMQNKAHRQVLEVKGAGVDPGVCVVTSPQNNQDSQLWFEDLSTGTIKSRLNLLCLDINDVGPGFYLQKSPHSPPKGTVCLSTQTDGGGAYYTAIAHTQWGSIPGKANKKTCWYAYGGREHLSSDYSWVVAPEVSLVRNTGCAPAGAMAVGHLTDGSGSQYAAIARSSWGTIAGRAQDNTCWYPYAGREHFTSDFDWVVAEQNTVILNTPVPGKTSQLWLRSGDKIQNRQDPNKVLQVTGKPKGSSVTSVPPTGAATQSWTFLAPQTMMQPAVCQKMAKQPKVSQPPPQPVYIPPVPQKISKTTAPRRYFYIRSELNGKVVDVKAESKSPGTMVVMWPKKQPPALNQLWYQDQEGIIHSRLTDFVLQPSGHGIWCQPYCSAGNQQWTISGKKIVNKSNPGRCIKVNGAATTNGTILCKGDYKAAAHEHWAFDYI